MKFITPKLPFAKSRGTIRAFFALFSICGSFIILLLLIILIALGKVNQETIISLSPLVLALFCLTGFITGWYFGTRTYQDSEKTELKPAEKYKVSLSSRFQKMEDQINEAKEQAKTSKSTE